MAVGTLEEIIDDNHAIVSTSVGSEYYVNMLSFVDKDLIEPGCTVLLNNKVCSLIIKCYVRVKKKLNAERVECTKKNHVVSISMMSRILIYLDQFHAVVGILTEDADPMVSVMKLEKAPNETYADIGGLDLQIQEIKVSYDTTYMCKGFPYLKH